MSSIQSWEGLAVAASAVGGFGVVIGQLLNKARNQERAERKKEIDDAIEIALTAADKDRQLKDQADEIKRLRGHHE